MLSNKIRLWVVMSYDIKNNTILCSLDALDYTKKWLEDTVKCMSEPGMDGSSAASSLPSSLLPLNVHNHAYLRLLRWDHDSDPFPEVHILNPVACCLDSLLVFSVTLKYSVPHHFLKFHFLCLHLHPKTVFLFFIYL